MVLRLLDYVEVKAVVDAARALVAARSSAADCRDASAEIDALERALATLDDAER